jgi:hypothetical protein
MNEVKKSGCGKCSDCNGCADKEKVQELKRTPEMSARMQQIFAGLEEAKQ